MQLILIHCSHAHHGKGKDVGCIFFWRGFTKDIQENNKCRCVNAVPQFGFYFVLLLFHFHFRFPFPSSSAVFPKPSATTSSPSPTPQLRHPLPLAFSYFFPYPSAPLFSFHTLPFTFLFPLSPSLLLLRLPHLF